MLHPLEDCNLPTHEKYLVLDEPLAIFEHFYLVLDVCYLLLPCLDTLGFNQGEPRPSFDFIRHFNPLGHPLQ